MARVRHVILGLSAVALLVVLVVTRGGKPAAVASAGDGVAKVQVFNKDGELVGPVIMEPVRKTDAQWRETLTPEQYRVVRGKGTERPFTGALLGNTEEGVYTCVACGLPLFQSDAKFHSGTGWPSFFRPIAPENVAEHEDRSLGMVRTEVTCPRCNAHLGHVFDDGPPPTGLRYCLNSVSLAFTPTGDLPTLADPVLDRPTAVLAGGCFWCVEAVFEQFDGVLDVESGYAGGSRADAKYKIVSSGTTNNAESVRVTYDPSKITYADLLRIHLSTHDPTQLDRQGHDVGHQYRSAIFYADPEQRATAEAVIAEFNEKHVWPDPIVTTLEPLTEFYPAEAYHQDYVRLHPNDGYVRAVSLPKVAKARKLFPNRLKTEGPPAPPVEGPTSRPE